jgi:hypothetical protein
VAKPPRSRGLDSVSSAHASAPPHPICFAQRALANRPLPASGPQAGRGGRSGYAQNRTCISYQRPKMALAMMFFWISLAPP